MKITIAHLYYDLMNLYGENGNVKALKTKFEQQEINVDVEYLSIWDNFDFKKYDIVYIGSGTENNKILVLKNLLQYKKEIKKYIEEGNYMISTGNSHEFFGKYIMDENNNKHDCLKIFDYFTESIKKRIVCENYLKTTFLEKPLIGFQNRNSIIRNTKNNLFEVLKGVGSDNSSDKEGYKYKNFYGTYLKGPLFVRNPHFSNFFIKKFLKEKMPTHKYKKIENKIEEKAYDNFVNNILKISKN